MATHTFPPRASRSTFRGHKGPPWAFRGDGCNRYDGPRTRGPVTSGATCPASKVVWKKWEPVPSYYLDEF